MVSDVEPPGDPVMTLVAWWPLPDATGLRDRLLAAYADPARGYHDLRHLTEVCTRLDELAAAGCRFDRTTVLLAAWFHDAVYDGERDAEERSARWAEAALPASGVDHEIADEVARLVRLTVMHQPRSDDDAGCVLSDADLAILAAPAERYAEYVAGVRREYSHVPDQAFASGRAAVLRGLLDAPTIYRTAPGREWWEPSARANLERELAGFSV